MRRAVEVATTSSPESGTQLLIDAIKPLIGNKFGKKGKLISIRDCSAVKIAMKSYKTWADVKIKKLPTTYSESGVELTTCHRAKGNEWKYVFLINVVNGEFPYQFKKGEVQCYDEEQRLFYVAASRPSKQFIVIESPVYKNNYGHDGEKHFNTLKNKSELIKAYRPYFKAVN